MEQHLLEICYLIASITFIVGLKMMSNPKTARRGNLVAAFGMGLAIVATIFLYDRSGHTSREPLKLGLIAAALMVGSAIGWRTALKVQMTKMPELVSMFNGMGGACAALIGLMEYDHNIGNVPTLLPTILGMVIGSVSFAGSIIAFLKLNGTMEKPIRLPFYNLLNTVVLVGMLGLAAFLIFGNDEGNTALLFIVFAVALLYGVLFVIPIGGADMPVVISLLNSFTGLAAAFGGFLYDNKVMLTGGILVGSAGTLLTIIMCRAMNRSLVNVIFGAFGGATSTSGSKTTEGGNIKNVSVEDAASIMNYSKSLIIIPGYGLAVAQAQHIIHELENLLEDSGVSVRYAIHPVAGRMPGHMNVLLAESNVSYDKLVEMEQINDDFPNTDVVFIVGANDVVNPAARHDAGSPIYGMPILNADKARTVIVSKRGMAAGYAGIDNELFGYDNCLMLFGDAKKSITQVVAALKEL
jgi:H+-translocating NAD(P) transhydrogenase subunit beta